MWYRIAKTRRAADDPPIIPPVEPFFDPVRARGTVMSARIRPFQNAVNRDMPDLDTFNLVQLDHDIPPI